jgi:LysR family hydrogen peroxide-inducible transcriptional activator
MNIQQLEYILAVDRFRNFTKASESCHVTQATLSAMVKKLEEELGVILFDRKQNPILTTDIGLQILSEAQIITEHSRILKDRAKENKVEMEGLIKIGIIPTIANALLPKIIKPILTAYPKLNLEILEINTFNIVEALKEGKIDLGILSTPVESGEMEEEILYYETLMVYGELNEEKEYILPEEIKNHKIWLMEEGHCLRDQFINLCSLKKKEILPNNLNFQANSFDTLLNMVDEFGGLTLIPELYYQGLPKERKNKIRFFNKPFPVREVSILYYRPYAKKNIILTLSRLIREIVVKTLKSSLYKNQDLTIVSI